MGGPEEGEITSVGDHSMRNGELMVSFPDINLVVSTEMSVLKIINQRNSCVIVKVGRPTASIKSY